MSKSYNSPEVEVIHLTTEIAFLGSTTQNGVGANITWSGTEDDFDSYFGS